MPSSTEAKAKPVIVDSTEQEEWRPVVGYEDCYHVSSLGRLKSLERRVNAWFGDRVLRERIMRLRADRAGYIKACLRREATEWHTNAHVLVLHAFKGPPQDGQEGRHRNGVRADCRATNLEWGTRKENMRDQYEHGTRIAGEKHPHAKITNEVARWVRESNQKPSDVAHALGVESRFVWRVRSGQTYSGSASNLSAMENS